VPGICSLFATLAFHPLDRMVRFRFVFVVFCVTILLLVAVFLRSSNDRMFYNLCRQQAQQKRLKQQLWQKELQVQMRLNPSEISQHLSEF